MSGGVRVRGRAMDLTAEKAERDQFEGAFESRINDLGVGGVERQKEGQEHFASEPLGAQLCLRASGGNLSTV